MKYRALYVRENANKTFSRKIEVRNIDDLPNNDTLVKVKYSSLNYKDALSASGHKGITRKYPFQPGIDAAGIVVEDKSKRFNEGDEVIITGYDLGMNTDGGFGEYIRVPSEWIVSLPKGLSMREAMMYGTAGFTAAICINEIENSEVPKQGKVLVTGASGGVGSLAVGMLSNLGYEVIATTGKSDSHDMLRKLGTTEIHGRDYTGDDSGRPLLSKAWDAAVDNVGGTDLSTIIKSCGMHGVICCLGNVAGDTFESTVYPFILRGVRLVGIDSASKHMDLRLKLWARIANDLKINAIDDYIKEVSLEGLSGEIDKILAGQQRGRVIVNFQS